MASRDPHAFLENFHDDPLKAIAVDVAGFEEAISRDPEALGDAMERAARRAGGAASIPASAFATAAAARTGRIVAADPAFGALNLPAAAVARLIVRAGEAAYLSAIVDDESGRPVALAASCSPSALRWPLSAPVRDAFESGQASCAILATSGEGAGAFPRMLSAWRLSGAETRLAAALVQTGDLRRAAAQVGVAYQTARDTLAAAMAKTGARRQGDFVRELTLLAFGDLPGREAAWRTLCDTYGLTERQARLAQLVTLGSTRGAAASVLRISEHSAKSDMKVIFERCGVDGVAALGRVVAEVDALSRLAFATDVEIVGADGDAEPLRFVRRRRAAGRIAVEDHGPAAGAPVVVFHTPMNGRRLPHVLVAAMQARGLRPVSVERPGFGLTSPSAPGQADFVAEANADLIDVLDALGIARARLLGRSAIMPLMFTQAHPERVESGVLLSASAPGHRTRHGLLGVGTSLILDRPHLIESLARMLLRLTSESSIERLTERAVGNCPSDLAALAETGNRRDWIRASRQSAGGNGFAREIAIHASGGSFPPAAYTGRWTVLFGEHDALGEGGHSGLAAWREALPQARVEMVPSGGRLLHMSHPDAVADALATPW